MIQTTTHLHIALLYVRAARWCSAILSSCLCHLGCKLCKWVVNISAGAHLSFVCPLVVPVSNDDDLHDDDDDVDDDDDDDAIASLHNSDQFTLASQQQANNKPRARKEWPKWARHWQETHSWYWSSMARVAHKRVAASAHSLTHFALVEIYPSIASCISCICIWRNKQQQARYTEHLLLIVLDTLLPIDSL